MNREDLWLEAVKTFGGTAAGLAGLTVGLLIFSNNGFDSAALFLVGMILIPTGLLALLTGVTGELGVSPRTLLAVYLQERRIRAAARAVSK